jgi:hypothetical protein
VPCFDPSPASRPSFAEVLEVARSLGGILSDRRHEASALEGSPPAARDNLTDPDAYPAAFWASPEGQSLSGVSVHNLSHTLLPAAIKATRVPFLRKGAIVQPPAEDAVTIAHTVTALVMVSCATSTCPRDGQPGCAYVDSLSGPDHTGPASALLSYSWAYHISDVVGALTEWTKVHHRDPARTYVWICSLCLNQHRMAARLTPDELAAEFGPRVTAIGRILPPLDRWDSPGYLTRAWCLFELFTAIRNSRGVEVNILLPPSQRAAFVDAMRVANYGALEAVLDGIQSEEATASSPADLVAIRGCVAALPGGFSALNEAVRGQLRRWFEGEGAVLTASRIQVLRRSSSTHLAVLHGTPSSPGADGRVGVPGTSLRTAGLHPRRVGGSGLSRRLSIELPVSSDAGVDELSNGFGGGGAVCG